MSDHLLEKMSELMKAIPESARPMVEAREDTILPTFVREDYLKDIYNLELRDTDVLIAAWPKSGTTWAQYIVTQLLRQQDDLAEKHLLGKHFFIEFPQDRNDANSKGTYELAQGVCSPRIFKTHLFIRFLPHNLCEKQSKVIYVARNPKDAAVSFYYFCKAHRSLPTYNNWDDFFDQLCRGLLPYGDWFEHVLEWWKRRNEPNVLFIKYEDMKKDLKKVVIQMGEFLEKRVTKNEVDEICENSLFENMRGNPAITLDGIDDEAWKKEGGKHIKFMRKGVVGDWKNLFTVAQSERFDKIYEEKMAGSDLNFSFE